jgi:hypothetical protein
LEVSKIAVQFYATCNYTIRTIEPLVNANENDLKSIVEKVIEMERHGNIGTWTSRSYMMPLLRISPYQGKENISCAVEVLT